MATVGATGLISVGHWPTVSEWSSNGTRPRTVPVSSVARFDFAYAVRAFLDPHRTVRGSAARIISARKANRKEVADYEHDAHQD